MKFLSSLLTIMVSALLLIQCSGKEEQVRTDTIQIQNPKLLGVETIPAQRIALGVPDDYKPSGGGFERTVQLDNGTLVTSYSYRGEDDKTHLEIVRWIIPE